MIVLLLAAALAQAPIEPPDSFAHPPAWPSFHFEAMDREAFSHLGDAADTITPPAEGVFVLGWLGTTMKGDPIRVWVYTRPDRSVVSSRLLHGDALERLYIEVEAWLKEHPQKLPFSPIPDDVPRLRVSR